jgi:hypothetical protein
MTFPTRMLDKVDRSTVKTEITCAECGETIQPANRHDLPCGVSVCEDCWCLFYSPDCQTCDGRATWCTFSK